jgi:hypothetical protein
VGNNQYVEQNNVILGDVTALASEKDDTILGLQKSTQEQEVEIRRLNLLLTNISSKLQVLNNLATDVSRCGSGVPPLLYTDNHILVGGGLLTGGLTPHVREPLCMWVS